MIDTQAVGNTVAVRYEFSDSIFWVGIGHNTGVDAQFGAARGAYAQGFWMGGDAGGIAPAAGSFIRNCIFDNGGHGLGWDLPNFGTTGLIANNIGVGTFMPASQGDQINGIGNFKCEINGPATVRDNIVGSIALNTGPTSGNISVGNTYAGQTAVQAVFPAYDRQTGPHVTLMTIESLLETYANANYSTVGHANYLKGCVDEDGRFIGKDGGVVWTKDGAPQTNVPSPVLSNALDIHTGTTTATASVDTTTDGTLYAVVVPLADANPTGVQIKNGLRSNGSAAVFHESGQAVAAAGTETLSPTISGLTDATAYKTVFYQERNSGAQVSNVIAADGFTTGAVDVVAPTVSSFSPADNATGVAVNAPITVTFSENVVFGTGLVTLRNVTDATDIETFNVETEVGTSPGQVSLSGAVMTITPTAVLPYSKNISTRIAATAIDDLAGNSYAGHTNDTTHNFSTVAAPSSGITVPVSLFTPVNNSPSNGTASESASFTPAGTRPIAILVATTNNDSTTVAQTITVTIGASGRGAGLGTAATLATSTFQSRTNVGIYVIEAPAASAQTIKVEYAGASSNRSTVLAAFEIPGALTSGVVGSTDASLSTMGNGQTLAVDMTTTTNGSLCIALAAVGTTVTGFAAATGTPLFSEQTTGASNGFDMHVLATWQIVATAGAAAEDFSWTTSKSRAAAFAEFKPAP
jgi:hypothetical protein